MRALRLPLLVALLLAAALAGGLLMPHGGSTAPVLMGTPLSGKLAPDFALRDQTGRTVSLSGLRGKPILLTFMQATCTELCPTVAETIHRALDEMGPQRARVAVVAVSADPEHDTPAAVRKFSREHGLLDEWHYLTGTRRQLTPIWRKYYLFVAPKDAPVAIRDAHTSAVYLLDRDGKERVLMAGDPQTGDLVRDLRILAGLPVGAPLVSSVPAAQAGHPAPGFTLRSLEGGTVHLAGLRGKIVLLNFWASWCTACRSEMPRLDAWYARLHGRGLVVLGVDGQDASGTAERYARTLGVRYPILVDAGGAVSARYDVANLPTTVLIDRQGRVASVHIGTLDDGYLKAHVAPLLIGQSG